MTRRVIGKGRNGEEVTRTAGQQARRDGNIPIQPMDGFEDEPIIKNPVIRLFLFIGSILILLSFFDGKGGW